MNTIPEEFRGVGYKVFDKDLRCRGYQYEIGKTFEHDGELSVCNSGFHLCDHLIDCFNYYEWTSENRVCIVNYDKRTTIQEDGGDKKATAKLYISHELTWDEVVRSCNHGHWNTGHSNTGDSNTGHSNTGHRNTGHWNTGHWNTGHWNTGYLCAKTSNAAIFDELTTLSHEEIHDSQWYRLLSRVSFSKAVYYSDMTEAEKEANPSAKTTGLYIKTLEPQQAWLEFWESLTEREIETVKQIPNFTAEKWQVITGIKT